MDLEGKRFGKGHKELGGACDLIHQFRLWPYYEFFCKKSLPLSVSETQYLHNVVGDTKIRKGEGMELDQLCRNTYTGEEKVCLRPFDLNVLSEAFHMREMDPIHLSSARKGLLSVKLKLKNHSRDNERKNRKDNHIDRKDEKHKMPKLHEVKDGSCIENNRIMHHDSHPLQIKNQQDKKRRAETSIDPSVSKRIHTKMRG